MVVALLLLQAVLLAWSAYRHSPTQDEVAHLPAGLAIWKFGDFGLYRVNPPVTRGIAALPVLFVSHEEDWSGYRPGHPLRQEWRMAAQFVEANGVRSLWLFTLARWACLPIPLLGGILCWWWGRKLAGPVVGAVSLSLWCTSPNILGYGSLITPDIPAVVFGLLAVYLFQCWREESTLRAAFFAGCGLGLALLSKTYWIILYGLWPTIFLIDELLTAGQGKPGRRTWRVIQLLFILVIATNVLNFGYGFRGTWTRLGELSFFSRPLAGQTLNPESEPPANRFQGAWLGEVPLPFPADFVTGIDVQRADFELGKWSYLFGEVRERGWWYYYLVGLAVKVPLGTWLLAALGGSHLIQRRSVNLKELWASGLTLLLVVSLVLFVLVSSQTGMSRHIRYAFPVLPALYLLAGLGFRSGWCSLQGTGARWENVSVTVCLLISIASLRTFPHSLSYFNELCGGVDGGDRVLIDANLDWGQDLIYLREWIEAHPEARPVCVDWIGYARLPSFGIQAPLMKPGQETPGWYIVSRHLLHAPGHAGNRFLGEKPLERIGGAFHVYRIE